MYDTMEYVRPEVLTGCMGHAASMVSRLLTAGAPGKRYCLPNAKVMIHQPSGGFQGQAADIEIHAREIIRTRERLNQIYVKHSGRSMDEIEKGMERDNFMTGEEAKAFGLIEQARKRKPTPVDTDKVGA